MKNYWDDGIRDFEMESESNSVEDPAGDLVGLKPIFLALKKNKWLITLFTALITALATYYSYSATPIYAATSTLLIESQRQANVVSVNELIETENENAEYYKTQYELLKSRGLAERVINQLDLWSSDHLSSIFSDTKSESSGKSIGSKLLSNFDFFNESDSDSISEPDEKHLQASDVDEGVKLFATPEVNQDSNFLLDLDSERIEISNAVKEKVIASFIRKLNVERISGTKLVKISFESADPDFSELVANNVAEQYIESYLDSKLKATERASVWLNSRLGDLKAQLDDSEQNLIAYKKENGLVDVNGSVGRLNEQELLLATAELADARSELADTEDLYNEVIARRGQPALLVGIQAIQQDRLIQLVKTEQGQRQRELDELLNRYGNKHPRVVDARSRLASLAVTMEGHVDRVISSIEKNYQLSQQRVRSIQGKLARGKEDILVLGTKRFELEELEREVQTKRNLYNTFFSRITEAKSAEGLETANARIIDYAVRPSSPVKPKKQLIIALALLSSLLLSMLMAIVYEKLDVTIKAVTDVEDRIGLRVLGVLPLMKPTGFKAFFSKNEFSPVDGEHAGGNYIEAVNTVRTAISITDAQIPPKLILVTSSVPNEGKSTTAVSLAQSFSKLERTLLIDCDLRRPSIAGLANLRADAPGLTDLIIGAVNPQDCIQRKVANSDLDVITSGSIPDKPLEFLSATRFQKILDRLSKYYDRIVIDSAPTQAVSDAFVLSSLCDAVVYIIKSSDTDVDNIRRGVRRLKQIKAPIIGSIITQVDIEKLVSYGGEDFYRGYYDYYGYGSEGHRDFSTKKISANDIPLNDIELNTDLVADTVTGTSESSIVVDETLNVDVGE